jgi:hypothetical protein
LIEYPHMPYPRFKKNALTHRIISFSTLENQKPFDTVSDINHCKMIRCFCNAPRKFLATERSLDG